MERMKRRLKNLSLRKTFILAMLITLTAVLAASGLTIAGGLAFQKWLMPEEDYTVINFNLTYSDGSEIMYSTIAHSGDDILLYDRMQEAFEIISASAEGEDEGETILIPGSNSLKIRKLENLRVTADQVAASYKALPPKRKAAYIGTSAAMVILPVIYAFIGIVLCAFWFYKRKLQLPIEELKTAAEHIGGQDLDFNIKYESRDEMGNLCDAFETMRETLESNQKQLWDLLEAKKLLQASMAHDLRNPIAIIQGYAEYLQMHLEDGTLDRKQVAETADKLELAAGRLQRYTQSIGEVSRMEELEVEKRDCVLVDILTEMEEDFHLIAQRQGIALHVSVEEGEQTNGQLDSQVLYRILENVVANGLRFAEGQIDMRIAVKEGRLQIAVSDDGPGFPQEVLSRQKGVPMPGSGDHMGMGLVICQILCHRHGGALKLSNRTDQKGAVVSIDISII